MPRRKPKTRHGATQPEETRKAKLVPLRLLPTVEAILRDQSELQGLSLSSLVSHLILDAWGDQYEGGDAARAELLARMRLIPPPTGVTS